MISTEPLLISCYCVFLSSLSRRTRGWWVRWTVWWMKWGEIICNFSYLSNMIWTAWLLLGNFRLFRHRYHESVMWRVKLFTAELRSRDSPKKEICVTVSSTFLSSWHVHVMGRICFCTLVLFKMFMLSFGVLQANRGEGSGDLSTAGDLCWESPATSELTSLQFVHPVTPMRCILRSSCT